MDRWLQSAHVRREQVGNLGDYKQLLCGSIESTPE